MKKVIYGFYTIVLLVAVLSCGTLNRADSDRELTKRSNITNVRDDSYVNNSVGDNVAPFPTDNRFVKVWVHAYETASGDYFHGGWITLRLNSPVWGVK